MHIFVAGLITETNSFSPIPTTLDDFESCCLSEEHYGDSFWEAPLNHFSELSENENWTVTRGPCAAAMPSGPVVSTTYTKLKNDILTSIKNCRAIDAIFLHLHGAMISEKENDCEGDLLSAIRKVITNKTIISILIDPHTHLTESMMEHADLIVSMQEYPHTDAISRTTQAFRLTKETLLGNIRPAMVSYDCKTIGVYPTGLEPMKSFLNKVKHIEQNDPTILSISPIHGFPWGDVPDMGSKMIVITDDDISYAEKYCEDLGIKFAAIAKDMQLDIISIDAAIDKLKHNDSQMPLVLADYADNVGGGAPGDSTFILQALLNHKAESFALSSIWDPQAVKIAMAAGTGNTINLRVGGKIGPQSGIPIDLNVHIEKITDNMDITFADGTMPFGNTVLLSITTLKNAYIIIHDKRCQTYSSDTFTNMGVSLKDKKALIVKSSTHFRNSFEKISGEIYIISSQGTLTPDIQEINYKHVNKTVYPATDLSTI